MLRCSIIEAGQTGQNGANAPNALSDKTGQTGQLSIGVAPSRVPCPVTYCAGAKEKRSCPVAEKPTHDLDYSDIDELDEVDEYQQLALIWCKTHKRYEWQWVEIGCIPGRSGEI
jgi:hypothetical protein